jgi:hypothetical protein
MPAALYPLLLVCVLFVLGSAFFRSELFGHVLVLVSPWRCGHSQAWQLVDWWQGCLTRP